MIGIIGYGIVGQATHKMLERNNVIFLDPNIKGSKKPKELLRTDIIFICLNVPTSRKSQDYSVLTGYLENLNHNNYKGVVVIRSTILPSCQPYTEFKNKLRLVAFPEFLTESRNFETEFNHIILGGSFQDCQTVAKLFPKFKTQFMSFNDAMTFKYVRNIYGAYKVLFWEFVQETTGRSRKMSDLLKYFPSGNYSQVGLDGFRGFGGKCFPKDVQAFENVVNHPLTKFILNYNNSLRSKLKEDLGCFG